jgi:chromosome segregation ATPase
MKRKVLFFATAIMLCGTIITSCQSKEEKVEDAKEEVQEAKEDLKDAQKELNAEYPTFKTAADEQITANENRIAELRKKINTGGKPLDGAREKRIQELQDENARLRSKLYGYEQERSDWEEFKREFNRDMDELGKSLNDLGKDNAK